MIVTPMVFSFSFLNEMALTESITLIKPFFIMPSFLQKSRLLNEKSLAIGADIISNE
jgi:hypothetical protein